MKNFNILNISTNSLIFALIALILVLIILILILIIKNSCKKSSYNFLENDNDKSITTLEIDNSDNYLDKSENIAKKIETTEKTNEKFDISKTAQKMQEDINSDNIDLTDFEIEQEEKSIISYKELLEKVNKDKNSNINTTKVNKVEIQNGNDLHNDDFVNNEYTFSTEVIDFETELKNEIKKQEQKEKNTILNIEENDFSHDEFLKSLKTLKDNLG